MGELKDPQNKSSQESGQDKACELQKFIAEIAQMKKEDTERGWPVHLRDVDPFELTDEDAAMYRKAAKDRSITEKDMEDYRKTLFDEKGEPKEGIPQSRAEFAEYIANLATVIIARRQLERRKKRQ